MNLYTVRDYVAEEAGPVFEAKNDEVAKRNFVEILGKTALKPSDFGLYCIGVFDHDLMNMTAASPGGRLVCDGKQYEEFADGK